MAYSWRPIEQRDPLGDAIGKFDEGLSWGRDQKFQKEAPEQFAQAAAPLSEFGLTTPADELKAMFRNPETRPLALQMVQEATQRRADASDPFKQLQLKKAQIDLANAQRGPAAPRNTVLENANTRAKLGWDNGLRGAELQRFTLTGEYPGATADRPNAPSGYQFTEDGKLAFIPGGPADPATKGADLTQGEQRNLQLSAVMSPALESVETNWAALTDAGNQTLGAKLNGAQPGYSLTSPEYQQATNALSTIIASYLYSVSGATATDEEIARQTALLTPRFGESKQAADEKLAQIRTMVKAVTDAAGNGAPTQTGADDPLGIR